MSIKEQILVTVCLCVCSSICVYTCAWAPCVFVSLCWSARWSAVPEFGQKVNNYSAYSVIMVPVSPATREEGAPSRLSSSVMKYRHWGALYTWIFINTGLTVMSPEQVGWDTHIRVRSIRQEAVGEMVKTSKFTLQEHIPTASWGCTPTHTYIHICLENNNKKQWLNVYSLLYAAWKFACCTWGKHRLNWPVGKCIQCTKFIISVALVLTSIHKKDQNKNFKYIERYNIWVNRF